VSGFEDLAAALVGPLAGLLGRLPLPGMEFEFNQRALLAVLLVAPMCAALGVEVVTFRMAFFSDAVAHSAYTGIAVGILVFGTGATLGVTLAMVAVGVAVGLIVAAMRERTRQTSDTVIGIVFSAAVALGLVIVAVSADKGLAAMIGPFLIGDALYMTPADVLVMAGLALGVYAFQAAGYNRLMLIGLNPVLARIRGVRTAVWGYLFAALLALVVTGSVRTVGVLVVGAFFIAPAAAARNVARSVGGMFWWALALAVVAALAGFELSIVLKKPPVGASIILCATAIYGLSELYRALRRG
jgi:zinc transport system permease protein